MITEQHAVLLPSLEIALIYGPHFIPAFIPACGHCRLLVRLREPLLILEQSPSVPPPLALTSVWHI